ncbi:MAG: hypothetical protein AB8G26_01570 [Ilumatobacter sp.]
MSVLAPPPASKTIAAYGYVCDPENIADRRFEDRVPPHRDCVGWWRASEDPVANGWRCACSCHEQGAGWPGYPG